MATVHMKVFTEYSIQKGVFQGCPRSCWRTPAGSDSAATQEFEASANFAESTTRIQTRDFGDPTMNHSRIYCILVVVLAVGWSLSFSALSVVSAQGLMDIEEPPFSYSDTVEDNRVSRLLEKIQAKELRLDFGKPRGHLESLLKALEIPVSSQTLVFSKTSMQVQHISRSNPRAIYFNDDTYVGWVRGSSLVEVSTADSKLGAAFYTVDMKPWRAKFVRSDYDCLGCHATSMTGGLPGHVIRSVSPFHDGGINAQFPSYVTSDSSPFAQRWGGWYVTGGHGSMQHMGNAFLRGNTLDLRRSGNVTDLEDRFDTTGYLLPTSDIAALMVLGHQTGVHNVFVKADFTVRKLEYDRALRQSEGQNVSEAEEAEHSMQIAQAATQVVSAILFCNEEPLTSPIKSSGEFVREFEARGPIDSKGRSLRQFDLQNRLFKYPCSFLVYTEAFDALQPTLRTEILTQLRSILTGDAAAEEYSHLDATTRAEMHEVLMETLTGYFSD
ncbi:hypothetical protein RBWH47_03369 [Rhodopirellula baltica WH47]|uniref:Cytochrome c domain-containing protein n=2 Tax=Rhodopirellula baltica TaxID=265606 RepID=F2AQ01_RHOBT|nr:hypothetical protein RBWH47_03369 [Rhodopirellula baltica WH47]